ncbi:hypothetical protein [Bradyrhizobium sp. CCGUVB23]|nr:hypothetical protein [Bradyrhizobium sp. CCGUVB23]
MHELAMPLPTQRLDGTARCFCGDAITNATVGAHVRAAHSAIGER